MLKMPRKGQFSTIKVFVLLTTLTVVLSAVAQGADTQAKLLQKKNAVLIIPSKNFQDKELFVTQTHLQNNGVNVTIASSSMKEARGMLGKTVSPDRLYSDLDTANYDAVIFIGGSGASQYFDDPVAHEIAIEAVSKEKIVGAICIAPLILAKAGILESKRATIWSGMAEELSSYCNIYTAKRVEVDGKVITANGPQSVKVFAEAIIKKLERM